MTRAELIIAPPPGRGSLYPAIEPALPLLAGTAPSRRKPHAPRAPAKPLAIVTIVPSLEGKPRAHYGRILIGPQHASAVARHFRTRKLGRFGGYFSFAIIGEKTHG